MINKNIYISIVIPVYKCSAAIEELYGRLLTTLEKIDANFEIIFINDASPENDWEIICKLAKYDKRVVAISLSRNFGQHYAIAAGLDCCCGEWVVVMDGDLQDQPEEIVKLHGKALEGYDIVVGIRSNRKDGFFKRNSSRLFFFVYNYLTNLKINNNIGNFGIYSNRVIKSIKGLREQNRSFGLFALWVGFKRIEIFVNREKRNVGKSSYSIKKLTAHAVDNIITHTDKLLINTIKLGFLISTASFFYVLYLLFRYFVYNKSVLGWTSLIVSIYLATGLILMAIGIMGIYIGKIFNEVKKRPLYIISESINLNKQI